MEPAVLIALIGGGVSIAITLTPLFMGRRKEKRDTQRADAGEQRIGLSERFDDASEMAKYIRTEVERQVTEKTKELSDKVGRQRRTLEMLEDAMRTRETQLWLWNQKGRQGEVPMLAAPILEHIGLGGLAEQWPTEGKAEGV